MVDVPKSGSSRAQITKERLLPRTGSCGVYVSRSSSTRLDVFRGYRELSWRQSTNFTLCCFTLKESEVGSCTAGIFSEDHRVTQSNCNTVDVISLLKGKITMKKTGASKKATKPSPPKAALKAPVKGVSLKSLKPLEGINLGNHNQTLLRD